MSIEVSALTRFYGEQKAIDSISFSVKKGEIVGFLGPNGAGKSTTMKILTGYLRADSGSAAINGINVQTSALQTKKSVGYLPEANPLYPEMYVREYLGFIAGIHELPNKKQAIEEIIAVVGLTAESNKKIGQLSKGYKQRVGLAAALVHNPDVLILDEPTTGLDPNQVMEIREVIKKYGRDKTVLFSSHILREVEAVCDRVIIINKGKLVADSRINDLRNEQSGDLIRVQFSEAVDAATLQHLSALKTLNKINDFEWELGSGDPELLKKQLLNLSLQNNLNIVSLQSGRRSLEDIFRNLTNNQNA